LVLNSGSKHLVMFGIIKIIFVEKKLLVISTKCCMLVASELVAGEIAGTLTVLCGLNCLLSSM